MEEVCHCGRRLVLLLFRKRDQAALLEPVALSADVDGGGVVQQPVEDGCCDDRIAEDRAPLSIALVRGPECLQDEINHRSKATGAPLSWTAGAIF